MERTTDDGAPSALPSWLAHVDGEERDELVTLGILTDRDTAPPGGDPAQDDATISGLMRRVHELDEDTRRHESVREHEHKMIDWRYEQILTPVVRRRTGLARAIIAIAERATFIGKAKSRKLVWGTFGFRKKGGALAITATDEEIVREVGAKHPAALDVNVCLDGETWQAVKAIVRGWDALAPTDSARVKGRLLEQIGASKVSVSKARVKEFIAAGGTLSGAAIPAKVDTPYFEIDPPPMTETVAPILPKTQSEFDG